MDKALLEATAAALVAPGKGILAADESNGTMSNRLEGVGLESSEEARRAYRANLFATPGCEDAISGVILYDETIRQNMDDGTSIPDYLTSRGIIPGIKVDTGTVDLEGSQGEKITKGIEAEPENGWDDLATRCAEYFSMGARFAKWRAVIRIEAEGVGVEPTDIPSQECILANAQSLAEYARICQDQGLVPIIEPEVLMDGKHDYAACGLATTDILQATWRECEKAGVHLPGALLKPNMILDGKDLHSTSADPIRRLSHEEVAELTLVSFEVDVPGDIGGIVFLSGGQSDLDATAHLNFMNQMAKPVDPNFPAWCQLSYSYGRALQAAALKAWAEEGPEASQAAFAHRAKMNSLARSGDWDISLESQ